MPEEQTSLQEALARIMGAPAGGTPQPPPAAIEVAPATPYSQNIANFMPTTDVALSNTPFDPFAEQNAELEAMKAQTAAMDAQLQQSIQQQATRPVYVPPPLPAVWTPPPQQAAPAPIQAPAPPPPPPPAPWQYGSGGRGPAPVIRGTGNAPVISGTGNAPVIRR